MDSFEVVVYYYDDDNEQGGYYDRAPADYIQIVKSDQLPQEYPKIFQASGETIETSLTVGPKRTGYIRGHFNTNIGDPEISGIAGFGISDGVHTYKSVGSSSSNFSFSGPFDLGVVFSSKNLSEVSGKSEDIEGSEDQPLVITGYATFEVFESEAATDSVTIFDAPQSAGAIPIDLNAAPELPSAFLSLPALALLCAGWLRGRRTHV